MEKQLKFATGTILDSTNILWYYGTMEKLTNSFAFLRKKAEHTFHQIHPEKHTSYNSFIRSLERTQITNITSEISYEYELIARRFEVINSHRNRIHILQITAHSENGKKICYQEQFAKAKDPVMMQETEKQSLKIKDITTAESRLGSISLRIGFTPNEITYLGKALSDAEREEIRANALDQNIHPYPRRIDRTTEF
jgi:hypothetical protein